MKIIDASIKPMIAHDDTAYFDSVIMALYVEIMGSIEIDFGGRAPFPVPFEMIAGMYFCRYYFWENYMDILKDLGHEWAYEYRHCSYEMDELRESIREAIAYICDIECETVREYWHEEWIGNIMASLDRQGLLTSRWEESKSKYRQIFSMREPQGLGILDDDIIDGMISINALSVMDSIVVDRENYFYWIPDHDSIMNFLDEDNFTIMPDGKKLYMSDIFNIYVEYMSHEIEYGN